MWGGDQKHSRSWGPRRKLASSAFPDLLSDLQVTLHRPAGHIEHVGYFLIAQTSLFPKFQSSLRSRLCASRLAAFVYASLAGGSNPNSLAFSASLLLHLGESEQH